MILLGGLALNAAPSRTSAKPRGASIALRRSVLSYYFLLPYLGNDGYEAQSQKRALLKANGEGFTPIVDLRHDYIEEQPDSSPVEQIAVFRGGGRDLVATSGPDYESDYNSFHL